MYSFPLFHAPKAAALTVPEADASKRPTGVYSPGCFTIPSDHKIRLGRSGFNAAYQLLGRTGTKLVATKDLGRVWPVTTLRPSFPIAPSRTPTMLQLAPISAPLASDIIDRNVVAATMHVRALFPDSAQNDTLPSHAANTVRRLVGQGFQAERYVWRLAIIYNAALWAFHNKEELRMDRAIMPVPVGIRNVAGYSEMLLHEANYVAVRIAMSNGEAEAILKVLCAAAAPEPKFEAGSVCFPGIAQSWPAIPDIAVRYVGVTNLETMGLGPLLPEVVLMAAGYWCNQHSVVDLFNEYVEVQASMWFGGHEDSDPLFGTAGWSVGLPPVNMVGCSLIPLCQKYVADANPQPITGVRNISEHFTRGALVGCAMRLGFRTWLQLVGASILENFTGEDDIWQGIAVEFMHYNFCGAVAQAQALLGVLGIGTNFGSFGGDLRPCRMGRASFMNWWSDHRRAAQWDELAPYVGSIPSWCTMLQELEPGRSSVIPTIGQWATVDGHGPDKVVRAQSMALLGGELGMQLVDYANAASRVELLSVPDSYRGAPSDWALLEDVHRDEYEANLVVRFNTPQAAVSASTPPAPHEVILWYWTLPLSGKDKMLLGPTGVAPRPNRGLDGLFKGGPPTREHGGRGGRRRGGSPYAPDPPSGSDEEADLLDQLASRFTGGHAGAKECGPTTQPPVDYAAAVADATGEAAIAERTETRVRFINEDTVSPPAFGTSGGTRPFTKWVDLPHPQQTVPTPESTFLGESLLHEMEAMHTQVPVAITTVNQLANGHLTLRKLTAAIGIVLCNDVTGRAACSTGRPDEAQYDALMTMSGMDYYTLMVATPPKHRARVMKLLSVLYNSMSGAANLPNYAHQWGMESRRLKNMAMALETDPAVTPSELAAVDKSIADLFVERGATADNIIAMLRRGDPLVRAGNNLKYTEKVKGRELDLPDDTVAGIVVPGMARSEVEYMEHLLVEVEHGVRQVEAIDSEMSKREWYPAWRALAASRLEPDPDLVGATGGAAFTSREADAHVVKPYRPVNSVPPSVADFGPVSTTTSGLASSAASIGSTPLQEEWEALLEENSTPAERPFIEERYNSLVNILSEDKTARKAEAQAQLRTHTITQQDYDRGWQVRMDDRGKTVKIMIGAWSPKLHYGLFSPDGRLLLPHERKKLETLKKLKKTGGSAIERKALQNQVGELYISDPAQRAARMLFPGAPPVERINQRVALEQACRAVASRAKTAEARAIMSQGGAVDPLPPKNKHGG